jgi:signal peptidase I
VRRLLRTGFVVLAVVGGLLVALALTSRTYRVTAASMEPTFHCPRPGTACREEHEDRILVSRAIYKVRDPHRGDIVAFRLSSRGALRCGRGDVDQVHLHRIVGEPGERVAVRAGIVYVDGKQLDEPYVKPDSLGGLPLPARTVPKDRYVVLGDNRRAACDSRIFGYVERDRIVGPVVATYWPLKRISIR